MGLRFHTSFVAHSHEQTADSANAFRFLNCPASRENPSSDVAARSIGDPHYHSRLLSHSSKRLPGGSAWKRVGVDIRDSPLGNKAARHLAGRLYCLRLRAILKEQQ